MIYQRWSTLQDVNAMRVADVNSDHHMILAKEKIKLAKNAKTETMRIRYNMIN